MLARCRSTGTDWGGRQPFSPDDGSFSGGHQSTSLVWILLGALLGARLYYVAQNEPIFYVTPPWHIVAVWEGGLAFFGGLFGAVGAAYVYARRARLRFAPLADLFAPAIPIAAAVARVACGLDGMDYGTPSNLPGQSSTSTRTATRPPTAWRDTWTGITNWSAIC